MSNANELTDEIKLQISKLVVRGLNNLTEDIEKLSNKCVEELSLAIQTDDDAPIYCFEKIELSIYEFLNSHLEWELTKPNASSKYPELFPKDKNETKA